MSHVTGGGLPGNLPRVLPDGLGARIEGGTWPRAPIFELVQRAGGIEVAEMRRAFNVGVGFVVVVAAADVARALEALGKAGEKPFVLGSVVPVATDCPYEERVQWQE
jgi:phosphoribosylformylglycinamidine cyclo-ligase